MEIQKIYQKLANVIPKEKIKQNEPMSKHTAFKIGGPADIFIDIDNIEELKRVLEIIKNNNIPFKMIGNGSNILVRDEGFRGIILKNMLNNLKLEEQEDKIIITASSGVKLGILGQKCLKKEIEGFEFASGIPGTIGGAIKMNAGAHGKEMKDIIYNVTYIDLTGNIKTISNKECKFEYRKSIFSKKNFPIIETKLKLKKGNIDKIKENMQTYANYRKEKQPIEFPSAGSTFKRGTDFITAKLIDEAGLKGYSIGGAQISTKHSGFIINKNNATAQDVIDLAKHVQTTIKQKFRKRNRIGN